MKVAVITDQHFGMRKGSRLFHDYFKKFYEDIFFPTLEREGITTLIDMGDTFDNRRTIDLWSLEWAKTNYFDRLRDMGITVYTIVGNHTAYFKNNNSVNTIDLLLREYSNMVLVRDHAEYTIGDTRCLFLGWINDENRAKIKRKIKSTKSTVCFAHLELTGYQVYRGFTQQNGCSGTADQFQKFDRVYSGHYHHRSNDGKVFYLGNPYEMFWNDCDDARGFTIWDSDTLEHTPINNPHRMFYKIYYEDTPYQIFDASPYTGKIVKLIVRRKSKPKDFEKFVDKLHVAGVEELKIIESADWNNGYIVGEDFKDKEDENTISLLNRFIDESDISLDKSRVKGLITNIYRKACEVE